jgi:hypothetical protein
MSEIKVLPYLETSLKATFSLSKVLANSSNLPPCLKIPDQSTHHVADSTGTISELNILLHLKQEFSSF